MFTCKQVSNALAKGDYDKLPWHKKAMLKLHVATCAVCGKYNRQVMQFYDASRGLRNHEEEELEHPAEDAPHMSDDFKSRLKAQMADAEQNENA